MNKALKKQIEARYPINKENRINMYVPDLVDFCESLITARDERLVERIVKFKSKGSMDDWHQGWDSACESIIQLIREGEDGE